MTLKTLPTIVSFVRTATPIGVFYLTEILVGLTDLVVVGALGTEELAAVGLAKTILFSVLVAGFAVLSIGTVLMAERPDPGTCGTVVVASSIIALPFIAVAVLIAGTSGITLLAGGYEASLVGHFEDYASVLAWALAPALFFACLKNVLTAIRRTGALTWLAFGIVFGNLGASILLVHGVGTWAGLGVSGAAWATLGVNAFAALALFISVLRSGFVAGTHLTIAGVMRPIRDIVRLGWAAGAQQVLESVLFVAVLYLLGTYSTLWLAAGAVVFAVMELNFALGGALGEVLSARLATARQTGAKTLRRLLWIGGGLAGACTLVFAGAVGLFAEATVALFSSAKATGEARSLMVPLLRWTAIFFVFDAWQIVFVHALRGLRQTVVPMVLSTSCYWILGLAGGLMLAEVLGIGALGIWIGFCAGLTSAALLLAVLAFRHTRD